MADATIEEAFPQAAAKHIGELEEQLDMMRNSELQLNLENPFEVIINEMVQLQRRKSQDYATDGDILNNMREVVKALAIPGYTVVEDCNAMVIRKTARITNLRGRPSSNESVRDSYLDRAVYAVLALVAVDEEARDVLVAEWKGGG